MAFMLYLPLHLLLLLSATDIGCAVAQSKNIDEAEAKVLALEALKPHDKNVDLHSLTADYSPGFYVFEIVSLNPETSLVVGNVAVNQKSGDVWDTAGHCRIITSVGLHEMQTQLRAELKITKQELKWQSKRPNCDAP